MVKFHPLVVVALGAPVYVAHASSGYGPVKPENAPVPTPARSTPASSSPSACKIDVSVPTTCDGSKGWFPVSVVGKGTYCTRGAICSGTKSGQCPSPQSGLEYGSRCVVLAHSPGVYGCHPNASCSNQESLPVIAPKCGVKEDTPVVAPTYSPTLPPTEDAPAGATPCPSSTTESGVAPYVAGAPESDVVPHVPGAPESVPVAPQTPYDSDTVAPESTPVDDGDNAVAPESTPVDDGDNVEEYPSAGEPENTTAETPYVGSDWPESNVVEPSATPCATTASPESVLVDGGYPDSQWPESSEVPEEATPTETYAPTSEPESTPAQPGYPDWQVPESQVTPPAPTPCASSDAPETTPVETQAPYVDTGIPETTPAETPSYVWTGAPESAPTVATETPYALEDVPESVPVELPYASAGAPESEPTSPVAVTPYPSSSSNAAPEAAPAPTDATPPQAYRLRH